MKAERSGKGENEVFTRRFCPDEAGFLPKFPQRTRAAKKRIVKSPAEKRKWKKFPTFARIITLLTIR